MPRHASPELELHRAVSAALDLVLAGGAWWTSIEHSYAGIRQGARRKSIGVKRGIPDVLVVAGGRALWVELKSPRGSLTPDQKAVHEQLRDAGGEVAVCRSVEQVLDALRSWGVPMREVA